MGSQPPLKIFFSKSGGVDRCSTPPSKIQGGGLRPPQPPPPSLAPLIIVCYFVDINKRAISSIRS